LGRDRISRYGGRKAEIQGMSGARNESQEDGRRGMEKIRMRRVVWRRGLWLLRGTLKPYWK
jgi:hypothetical protein